MNVDVLDLKRVRVVVGIPGLGVAGRMGGGYHESRTFRRQGVSVQRWMVFEGNPSGSTVSSIMVGLSKFAQMP